MPRLAKKPSQECHIQENIIKYRKLKGLTQQELADEIGLSRSGLADIETGKNKIYGEVIARISKALQVSTDILLGISPSELSDYSPSIRLVRRLQEIEQLPEAKRKHVLRTIDDLLKANSPSQL